MMANRPEQVDLRADDCDVCGQSVSPDDLVEIRDHLVCWECKPGVVQKIKEGALVPVGIEYGGFWIRWGAKIIDGMILSVTVFSLYLGFMLLMVLILGGMGSFSSGSPFRLIAGSEVIIVAFYLIVFVLSVGVPIGYNTFFLAQYSATPGKMLCGLKVVRVGEEKFGWKVALGRTLAEQLSRLLMFTGYLMAAFDEEKRTLHDRLAGTRVVVD